MGLSLVESDSPNTLGVASVKGYPGRGGLPTDCQLCSTRSKEAREFFHAELKKPGRVHLPNLSKVATAQRNFEEAARVAGIGIQTLYRVFVDGGAAQEMDREQTSCVHLLLGLLGFLYRRRNATQGD